MKSAAASPDEQTPASPDEQTPGDADDDRKQQRFEAILEGAVERLSSAALEESVADFSAEAKEAKRVRQIEKLAVEGKRICPRGLYTRSDEGVADIVAFDDKRGRYIALKPESFRLQVVKPSAVCRRAPSPEVERPPTPEEEPDYWSDHGQFDDDEESDDD